MKIKHSTFKRNQGLSLIEMMISMVLGLFLILGLTTMYLGSKKTDKVRNAVSDVEENARLTLNALRAAIEHAGYKSINNIYLENPFQIPTAAAIPNPSCRDSDSLITNATLTTLPLPTDFTGYTADGDVDDDESDRITVIYHADNPTRGPIFFDCGGEKQSYFDADDDTRTNRQIACSTDSTTGFSQPEKSKIYNGLYVQKSDKTLRCVGSRGQNGSIVLADNVENMQILYGVYKDDVTTYKKASDVSVSDDEWEAVTSVQVAILVASEREVLDKAVEHEMTLLDETITKGPNRKLYRTFSTTIHLPNRSRRELQTVTRTSDEET